jgi:hypothetical protein
MSLGALWQTSMREEFDINSIIAEFMQICPTDSWKMLLFFSCTLKVCSTHQNSCVRTNTKWHHRFTDEYNHKLPNNIHPVRRKTNRRGCSMKSNSKKQVSVRVSAHYKLFWGFPSLYHTLQESIFETGHDYLLPNPHLLSFYAQYTLYKRCSQGSVDKQLVTVISSTNIIPRGSSFYLQEGCIPCQDRESKAAMGNTSSYCCFP